MCSPTLRETGRERTRGQGATGHQVSKREGGKEEGKGKKESKMAISFGLCMLLLGPA